MNEDKYDFKWSQIQKHGNLLKDQDGILEIDYTDGILSKVDDLSYTVVTSIKKDDFKYTFIDRFIEYDGSLPDKNNANTAYIAYSLHGKNTIASQYTEEVHILAYLNINRNDVNFYSNNQGYTSGIDKKHVPSVEYFQEQNIGVLDINVRDYLGAPFIGQAINGIYPC